MTTTWLIFSIPAGAMPAALAVSAASAAAHVKTDASVTPRMIALCSIGQAYRSRLMAGLRTGRTVGAGEHDPGHRDRFSRGAYFRARRLSRSSRLFQRDVRQGQVRSAGNARRLAARQRVSLAAPCHPRHALRYAHGQARAMLERTHLR